MLPLNPMSNNTFLIEERTRDIGNFLVGRLLPFKEKRLVGPFCFIDHMGPSVIGPEKYIDIDQHPHIGLCTLTYLLQGEIEHRDSTGAQKVISPGSVNLMVSGKGVSHTERTPQHLRNGGWQTLHGYQVWIALPVSDEECTPAFYHIGAHELPTWSEDGLKFTLVAGEGYGRKSPTPTFSPLFMVDVQAKEGGLLDIKAQLQGEIAIVVVEGEVWHSDQMIDAGQMLVSKTENECSVRLGPQSRVLLFGGQPFPEERFLYWNFVSHSKERLEQAKTDWRNRKFRQVPGDGTYIALPK